VTTPATSIPKVAETPARAVAKAKHHRHASKHHSRKASRHASKRAPSDDAPADDPLGGLHQ
jgi:hypothetical protein